MKVKYIINNYVLGAKLRTTPTHKIELESRLDSKHTVIIYNDLSEREVQFVNKVLANKGEII